MYFEGVFPKPASLPTRQMGQRDLAFDPALLAVRVGTKVDFPNFDDTYHDVFSFLPAKRFDLGRYRPDAKPAPSQTFDTVGLVTLAREGLERRFPIQVEGAPYLVFYKGAESEFDLCSRLRGLPLPAGGVAGGATAAALADRGDRRARARGRVAGQPVPYENVTAASDTAPPASPRDFRKVDADEKYEYLPVIWGPSYTTGLTLSGRTDHFDYAAELKNAALSSRPESWSATEIGFDHPAFNGRVGFRPDLAWNLGVSAGDGAYLRPEAGSVLPAGRGVGDYREILFGQDVSYSAGRWQLWAECFESRFEIPREGHLDTLSYYLETRYKFTPQLFGALRWNQQVFAAVRNGSPTLDTERVDAALSYRFTAHVQLKLQYSFQGGKPLIGQGSMVVRQLTVRF